MGYGTRCSPPASPTAPHKYLTLTTGFPYGLLCVQKPRKAQHMNFDDLPLFRASDPDTSRDGGKAVQPRRGSQAMLLLSAYKTASDGLTDEQAGDLTGLSANRKCCYWKRCSELRATGLIIDTLRRRNSSAGSPQMVCEITEEGLTALKICEAKS